MKNDVRGRISQHELPVPGRADEQYRWQRYWDRPPVGDYLARHASTRGSTTAFSDPGVEVSWERLDYFVRRAVMTLASWGVHSGDIVVVRGGNSVDLVATMLAVHASGAVLCPVQDRSTMPELGFIMDQTESRFCWQMSAGHLDTELDEFWAFADERASRAGNFAVVSVDDWSRPDATLTAAWSGAAPPDPNNVVESPATWTTAPGAPCRLLYTSGSTGDPKGVLHTNDTTVFACETSADLHHWTPESVGWIALPVTLNWGLFQMYSVVVSGAHGVLRSRFDADELLAGIDAGRVTHVSLPPTGLTRLVETVEAAGKRPARRPSCVISTGALCAEALLNDIRRTFDVAVVEAYGMTEGGWIATNRLSDAADGRGTVGQPTPGTRIRIRDADNRDVQPGAVGAVQINGPNLFKGYFRNERRTAESMTPDGWFRTGDQGYLRHDGRLVLVGRDKDAIKHAGQLISPREIEEILMESALVRAAAVVGVPDHHYGERIVAVVEPTEPAQHISLQDIRPMVQGRLSKYKWPQSVITVHDLPRTSTGKIQKPILVQQILTTLAANDEADGPGAVDMG